MTVTNISPEMLEALPTLHHEVALALIRKGTMRVTGGDPEELLAQPEQALP